MNIATVIAAGNDGWRDSINSPGCISSAISVGATTKSDDVASFSNVYPQIHLLAPGVGIVSSVPGGGTRAKSGTSMATPQFAGTWAVLKQRNPAASVDGILAALQNTGTPVDDLRSGGTETGMPRINVDLALGEPHTTFGICNDGLAALTVSSITPATSAPWISWSPTAPFDVQPGEYQVVNVCIDFNNAPGGHSQTRLMVNSNDLNESPYPGGVYANVRNGTDAGFSGSTVVVVNRTFDSNATCAASPSLTARNNVIVLPGVTEEFIAPAVQLGSGFSVGKGAVLKVEGCALT